MKNYQLRQVFTNTDGDYAIIAEPVKPAGMLEGQEIKTFKSEGTIRLSSQIERINQIGNVPISKTKYGEPEGLPEYQKGTYYIVS